MLRRILGFLLVVMALDWAPVVPPIPLDSWGQARAQVPPPDRWHPYQGGRNCIQVNDVAGNFSCAPGTTVDPATGNMVIGGTLAFGSFLPGTFVNGLALAAVGTTVQLLGPGDLFIQTSPPTIAPAGALAGGVTLRVRQGPAGNCMLVVTGGNSFGQEFIIPVVPRLGFQAGGGYANLATPPIPYSTLLTFPGGPSGC